MRERPQTDGTTSFGRRPLLQALGLTAGAVTLGSTGVLATDSDGDEAGEEKTEETGTSEGAAGDGPVRYQLPPLPYGYGALEPHVDRRIMELHHDEHHESYVDSTNELLGELETRRETGDFEGIKAVKRDLSFNLSGHVLHTVFWENMSPDGGGEPDGELRAAIEATFGSVETFEAEFSAAANQVEGVGWALLVYEHVGDTLEVVQTEKHNDVTVQGTTPLLVLDVWEHAYYLQYENRRSAYVDAWWNVVDWDDVARRYRAATTTALFERGDDGGDGET